MEITYKGKEWDHSEVDAFLKEWRSESESIEVPTSGSTGEPRPITITKKQMLASALLTQKAFKLKRGCKALLCLPVKYIAGMMMVVRAEVIDMELIAVEPSASPMKAIRSKIDFAAMTPMQVANSLNKIELIDTLIVGGGRLSDDLRKKLLELDVTVWETYGMTETVTHVAVRALDEHDFVALKEFTFSTNPDMCLVIHGGHLPKPVTTNDIVRLTSNIEFRLLGRKDNVINSGGIKSFPEQIESKIPGEVMVMGVPDDKLGERIVCVVEEKAEAPDLSNVSKHNQPKEVVRVDEFVRTENGKINREETAQRVEI